MTPETEKKKPGILNRGFPIVVRVKNLNNRATANVCLFDPYFRYGDDPKAAPENKNIEIEECIQGRDYEWLITQITKGRSISLGRITLYDNLEECGVKIQYVNYKGFGKDASISDVTGFRRSVNDWFIKHLSGLDLFIDNGRHICLEVPSGFHGTFQFHS